MADACFDNVIVNDDFGGMIKSWMRHFDVKLTISEYEALVSFIYNTGAGTFKCGSSGNTRNWGTDTDGSRITCRGNNSAMWTALFGPKGDGTTEEIDHVEAGFQIYDGWENTAQRNRRRREKDWFYRDMSEEERKPAD